MEKNMQTNFEYLERRVIDSLDKTDLEFIKFHLEHLKTPTLISGVGGSSVVSQFASRMLQNKNKIITLNTEPRDFAYSDFTGFQNVISCSYSGNNYGVDLSFDNDLNHYLLSNGVFENPNVIYLQYKTAIENERSFISLGATMVPISVLLSYYLDNNHEKLFSLITPRTYDFDPNATAFEIFSGIDTSTTSKYLESTLVESGIGIPIVHDKYSYCHGRSTTSKNNHNIAIYLNRNTELDRLLLSELPPYYNEIVVLDSKEEDQIADDYQMLWQAMYLTKYLAQCQNKDLSKVDYQPVVKKLYKFNGQL